jgi:hypothetical protein
MVVKTRRAIVVSASALALVCCEDPDPGFIDSGVEYTVSVGIHIDDLAAYGFDELEADIARNLSQYNREFCNISQFFVDEVSCDVSLELSPELNIFGVPGDGLNVLISETARRDRQCLRDQSGFRATFLIYTAGFIPGTLGYGVSVAGCESAVVRAAAFRNAPDVFHHEFGHLAGYNGGGPEGHEPDRRCGGGGRVFMCPSGSQDVVYIEHCRQLKRYRSFLPAFTRATVFPAVCGE